MTCVRAALCVCVVLVRGAPSSAEVSQEMRHDQRVQQKAARPATQSGEALEPMRIGGEVSAPKPVSRLNIRWPDNLTECYQLGVAVFEGVVDKYGVVHKVKLIKGPDNEYTRAAREAIMQQTFEPARYRGKPVDVTYHVSINHVPVKKVKGPCQMRN